jgi:glutamate-ammonia-ligase adenylyltransferase
MDIFKIADLPDPERAKNNIDAFLSQNPEYNEKLDKYIYEVSNLFSYSQFLANYCIKKPKSLFSAIEKIDNPFDTDELRKELRSLFESSASIKDGMNLIRDFRKDYFLILTLQDILKIYPIQDVMIHMSNLADVILSESLSYVESFLKQRYGEPENNSYTLIGLGKLGAQELNYSSDVDVIFVYKEEGETTGIRTVSGIRVNKISAFEYYVKLVEEFSRFLSANTENSFAYRVDLRLRPQGQRGSLAMSLSSYEQYYESWGQLWERAVLIRTRPIAGDKELGNQFLNIIEPFVYRRYLDFDAIDEIRRMKSQVEQIKGGSFSRDIKRGYGGIREIEFFIQIFQLIYGGKYPILRERSTFRCLHKLLQRGFIGYEDYAQLSDNYIFLRTLEHRLQQLNDIQTHTIPSNEKELHILSKKMGFSDSKSFLEELNNRRRKVRTIYDSLLETKKTEVSTGLLSSIYWDMDSPIEDLLVEELKKKNIKDITKTIYYLMKIRSNVYSFQTIRSRRLLEEILSKFIDDALNTETPELTILNIVDFSSILTTRESYLEFFIEKPEIISLFNFIFCHSEYLSKMIMVNPEYMEKMIEGLERKKSLGIFDTEIKLLFERFGESKAIRLFKKFEEIRLGILFLNKKVSINEVMKSLSMVAEVILSALLKKLSKDLNIVAFGKLGGREIIFNSDLDLIFLTEKYPKDSDIKSAEQILRTCLSYTKEGIAYKIDTRLRPDGSKGPLVNSLEAIGDYYLRHAQLWELQALLKARPVQYIYKEKRDFKTLKQFMDIRRDVLIRRGDEITLDEIKKMRARIKSELSKEVGGSYDIKLGEGGLEDLEFIVQYLQLKNCKRYPEIIVQGTLDAIYKLNKNKLFKNSDAERLKEIYLFYRVIEALLRLRNETLLKQDTAISISIANFMGMGERDLFNSLIRNRAWIKEFSERLNR